VVCWLFEAALAHLSLHDGGCSGTGNGKRERSSAKSAEKREKREKREEKRENNANPKLSEGWVPPSGQAPEPRKSQFREPSQISVIGRVVHKVTDRRVSSRAQAKESLIFICNG
jgi:hypothetical protein